MSIADDSETRTETPIEENLNRFRGLTPEKIRMLIEIDERALGVSNLVQCMVGTEERHGVDTIEVAYERAGFRFGADTIREYARRAEARGDNLCAEVWYDAYADHADDSTLLRRFLIARGWLERAKERLTTLTTVELRDIGDAALEHGDSNAAISAYTACGHRAGITAILRKALRNGREVYAEETAKALGRELTKREQAIIVRRHMHNGSYREAFARIREHRLTDLYRPLIARAMKDTRTHTKWILKWAKTLKVAITNHDLVERFNLLSQSGDRSNHIEAIWIAERIAKGSKLWRKDLPAFYAVARKEALEVQEPKTAECFGRKCGKPLTPTELLKLAEYFNGSGCREFDWSIESRKFCLDLAVKRIAKAVGAKNKKA